MKEKWERKKTVRLKRGDLETLRDYLEKGVPVNGLGPRQSYDGVRVCLCDILGFIAKLYADNARSEIIAESGNDKAVPKDKSS